MTGIIQRSTARFYIGIEQGSDEWLEVRRGMLTGSVMKNLLTKGFKPSTGAMVDTLLYQLLAERISGRVDDNYQSWDMIRGHTEEIEARDLYATTYAPVQQCGFVTNDKWGFTLGFSPDGLLRGGGFLEAKSRKQKLQIRAIVESISQDQIDAEFQVQVQTGLLVMERQWCDHISYSNGLPMAVVRVGPDRDIQEAILSAAESLEKRMTAARAVYDAAVSDADKRMVLTEWKEYARPGDDEIEGSEDDE